MCPRRVAFIDAEGKSFKHGLDDALHERIRQMNVRMPVFERRRLEQAAVEIWDVAEEAGREVAIANRRVEATEEEGREHGAVEGMSTLNSGVETIDQKAALVVQPSLLLDEVEKEKSREDEQGLRRGCFRRFSRELPAKCLIDFADRAAEPFEELPRQGFAVERAIEEPRMIACSGRRQQIETIERVRRWILQVDVQPPQIAMFGEIVERQLFRRPGDQRRLAKDVVRLKRAKKSQHRIAIRQFGVGDDVAVQHLRARRQIKG